MIGYSDSSKDAGKLAASWAQYCTQEKLQELSNTSIKLILHCFMDEEVQLEEVEDQFMKRYYLNLQEQLMEEHA